MTGCERGDVCPLLPCGFRDSSACCPLTPAQLSVLTAFGSELLVVSQNLLLINNALILTPDWPAVC